MHQPSSQTFGTCDKLLLLSQGQTAYDGMVGDLQAYFASCGQPVPGNMNPAEHALDYVNTDFNQDPDEIERQLRDVCSSWQGSDARQWTVKRRTDERARHQMGDLDVEGEGGPSKRPRDVPWILIRRSFIKSYRDFVAYNIRLVMYLALALMMGTVWLRLSPTQENIQSFINAIFFGGAFVSFMAIAYIPAYLEDLAIFMREQADGLYGPGSFLLANFVIGVPHLLATSLLFSLVAYWLSNFRPTADGFFVWTVWLFLDLLAAESLVIFISSLIPVFVVALAATAFANGLWMCAGGFLVPPHTLNPFWRYLFHFIDYQSYVFQGMTVNEFGNRNYACASTESGGCSCKYRSELESYCLIDGSAVLESYGFGSHSIGGSIAIMLAIIASYRALAWLVLYAKTRRVNVLKANTTLRPDDGDGLIPLEML